MKQSTAVGKDGGRALQGSLLYQMKSVCSYYRNQGLVFLRSLANLDDWDGDLKSVTDAEVALQKDSDQYNSQYAKSSLGRLVELAKRMETLLEDVHQSFRDFIVLQKEDTKCLCGLLWWIRKMTWRQLR